MDAHKESNYAPLKTYLELESAAHTKSEYLDGEILSRAGARLNHVFITSNVYAQLIQRLKNKSCMAFGSDLRVFVEKCNSVFYPDISVCCEDAHFSDTGMATILNPNLIIEVLAPSTERYDRGIKFDCYRTLESLSTYSLISQTEPRIEVYSRLPDGGWRYESYTSLESEAHLSSIGCALNIAEAYTRVEFPVVENGGREV